MSSSDESCVYVDTVYLENQSTVEDNSKQKEEDQTSDSIVFISETKNDSGSYFGDDELSATETSSFSCESPPDYTEQLKKLYSGVGSMILQKGKKGS